MQNTAAIESPWFLKTWGYLRDTFQKERWLKKTSTHNETDISPAEVTSLRIEVLKIFQTAKEVVILSLTWDVVADGLIQTKALVRVGVLERKEMKTLYQVWERADGDSWDSRSVEINGNF